MRPASALPFFAGVWHPMQPASVTRYSPYFTLLVRSGEGTWPAGLGAPFMNKDTGNAIRLRGTGCSPARAYSGKPQGCRHLHHSYVDSARTPSWGTAPYRRG